MATRIPGDKNGARDQVFWQNNEIGKIVREETKRIDRWTVAAAGHAGRGLKRLWRNAPSRWNSSVFQVRRQAFRERRTTPHRQPANCRRILSSAHRSGT